MTARLGTIAVVEDKGLVKFVCRRAGRHMVIRLDLEDAAALCRALVRAVCALGMAAHNARMLERRMGREGKDGGPIP